MKHIFVLLLIVALMALTVTTALANHGASLPTAPMPAHGSIWFGEGMSHYEGLNAKLTPPLHGSIWFGEGVNMLLSHAK